MSKLVSVLMSVHNEKHEYLELAISSILNQTYPDIELIIINDKSDNGTSEYLRIVSRVDKRIRLVENEENLGLTSSLNKGILISKGEFIARMDADDYSKPRRIEKQIKEMELRPEIDILGTEVVSFGDKYMFMSPPSKMNSSRIKCELFFTSVLCHPSVMIRKSFLTANHLLYDETVKKGQDYDLWERSSVVGEMAILGEVLLYYRIHSEQITSKGKLEQEQTAKNVMARRIERLGISPSPDQFRAHFALKGILKDTIEIGLIEVWMNTLLEANYKYNLVDNKCFHRTLRQRYVLYCLKQKQFGQLKAQDIVSVFELIKERTLIKLYLKREIELIVNTMKKNGGGKS